MYKSELDAIANNAVAKYETLSTKPSKYFMRSIVAGFFIVVATILSNVSAAVLYPTYPEFAKLIGAFLFPIAIILIVFIGGDLFTGNNMTMAIGVYQKRCSWKQAGLIWIASYIGNFIGCFLFAYIFIKSNASQAVLENYYNAIILPKLELTPVEMVLRGTLCNFMVCLAVFTATRMKTESGKLVVMFMVIMAFVVAGFEHSIANMGTFSIAYFICDGLPMDLVLKSMFFVTIGNIIGGAFLLGWPLKVMSADE